MLALLEARLEEVIALSARLPTEEISSREHACEKERRQVRAESLMIAYNSPIHLASTYMPLLIGRNFAVACISSVYNTPLNMHLLNK